jgi:hypothetical protein
MISQKLTNRENSTCAHLGRIAWKPVSERSNYTGNAATGTSEAQSIGDESPKGPRRQLERERNIINLPPLWRGSRCHSVRLRNAGRFDLECSYGRDWNVAHGQNRMHGLTSCQKEANRLSRSHRSVAACSERFRLGWIELWGLVALRFSTSKSN